MHVYVCMYMYVSICMYVYVCVCVCVYMCEYATMHTCMCMHNILGELSGGNVLPKTGWGIVWGNYPRGLSGGIDKGGIVLHPCQMVEAALDAHLLPESCSNGVNGSLLEVANNSSWNLLQQRIC